MNRASSFLLLLLMSLLWFRVPTWSQKPEAADLHQAKRDPEVILPAMHESIVITATPLAPSIDFLSAEAFGKTLFSRDDQVFHLLNAGMNAGQHEGGGKSLEIRRFGFNLDHGGVNGGVKVLVDNIPQNHSTQGHGQGYLGGLKTLTPELVEEVEMVNGPFSAEFGDYSGLGVVHIRLRESLPDQWTVRLHGGSYDSLRAFAAFSPNIRERDALFSYEGSHSDGPFLKPLDYRRDNVTGNYTWVVSPQSRFGLKWNGGRNDFKSSGQVPLDEVAAGRLDRFGSASPGDGGHVVTGKVGGYFRRDLDDNAVIKLDGFIERSLFDLFSNFTFYLNDPVNGDGIQQHDSRLSQGANAQYVRPQIFDAGTGLLTVGGNFLATQTDVGLWPSVNRNPIGVFTSAHANVINAGGYAQQKVALADGRLALAGGLRWDSFRFAVTDHIEPQFTGAHTATRLQPKAGVSFTPSHQVPFKTYLNYGRGISSLDARGVVRQPGGPFVATTDFWEAGTVHHFHPRFSLLTDFFWIQPSRQLVYIPDDGSIEFADPSRSHGFEAKTAVQLTAHIGLDAGITKVLNAYFRNTPSRIYLDSAPRFVSNAALTLADWRGWSASLRMRAINHYRLDGEDPSIQAAGHTVIDFAMSRSLRRGIELNFAADNLTNRKYWETQNFFESQLPGQPPIERIHATPGYGTTITVGMTMRFGGK